MPEDWFAIGRTVRVHGLKGCLKATSYLESDRLLRDLDEILLGGEEEGGSPFKVRNIETRGKEFLLQVEGIEDESRLFPKTHDVPFAKDDLAS